MIFPIKKIQIETSNLCNLSCAICPRDKLRCYRGTISLKLFKKILKRSKGIKRIDLTGWGEPLLNPKILDLIKIGKKNNLFVSFTTNGYCLDEKMGRALDNAGLNELAFSLDSLKKNDLSSHYGHSAKNIKKFMKLKTKIKTRIQAIIFDRDIKRIQSLIDFARDNNIFCVRLMRFDDRFCRQRKIKKTKEKEIFFKLLKYAKLKKIKLEMVQYYWGDFPVNLMTQFIQKTLFKNTCPKLLSFCYVNLKGEVTPCCNLPRLKMGDLKKENLDKIWKNIKFREFRRNYKNYCDDCEILTE